MNSLEDCDQVGKAVASQLSRGDVVVLEGEMGSGKTTFVGSVCRALGCEDGVSSPTFAIVHEYAGPVVVRHLDLYRLDLEAIEMMDISRYLDFPEGIVMIEWPSRLGVLMPEKVVRVSIEVVSLEGGRRVCFQ